MHEEENNILCCNFCSPPANLHITTNDDVIPWETGACHFPTSNPLSALLYIEDKTKLSNKMWPIIPTPSHVLLFCVCCAHHTGLFFFFLIASSNKPSCFLSPNLWICSSLYLECFCLHLHEASDFLSVKCQPKCHPPARPSLFTVSKACPLLVLYGIKIYFKPSINKAV